MSHVSKNRSHNSSKKKKATACAKRRSSNLRVPRKLKLLGWQLPQGHPRLCAPVGKCGTCFQRDIQLEWTLLGGDKLEWTCANIIAIITSNNQFCNGAKLLRADLHIRDLSFWQENVIVGVILLRVLARMSCQRTQVIKCYYRFYYSAVGRQLNQIQ